MFAISGIIDTPSSIRMVRFYAKEAVKWKGRPLHPNGSDEEKEILAHVNRFITLHESSGFVLVNLTPVVVDEAIVQYILHYRLTNPSGLPLLEFEC